MNEKVEEKNLEYYEIEVAKRLAVMRLGIKGFDAIADAANVDCVSMAFGLSVAFEELENAIIDRDIKAEEEREAKTRIVN